MYLSKVKSYFGKLKLPTTRINIGIGSDRGITKKKLICINIKTAKIIKKIKKEIDANIVW